MPRPGDHEYLRTIGSNLAKARADAELTQEAAAARLGLDRPQTLGAWEAGKANFSVSDFAAMCRLYRRSADWVLGISEEPTIPPAHAVIDRRVEIAAIEAESQADFHKAVEDLDAFAEPDGVEFGYKVPRKFEVVTISDYDRRRKAAQDRVAKLPASKGKRRDDRGK